MVRKFFKSKQSETESESGSEPRLGPEPEPRDEPFMADETASTGADAMAWISDTLDQAKGYGADKLEETAERLNGALPYIERAGFHVTEIEVLMGITPALIPHVQVRKVLQGEAREALLAEVAEFKLTGRIIGSLFRAADFGRRVDLKGFEFFEIEIEVGIIPSIKVKYAPVKRIAP